MRTNPVLIAFFLATTLSACQSLSAPQAKSTEDGIRQINQVTWDKTGARFQAPDDTTLANDQSRLIFVRKLDQDNRQTSANISIDHRFQVSLQSGQYSEVIICAGNHTINTETTANKNNQHTSEATFASTAPQSTYYFQIDIDDHSQQPSIRQLSTQQALTLLNNSVRQTHQISRVVPDCDISTPTQTPTPAPIITRAPEQKNSIETNTPIKLDILFDFDSATIQPNYYQHLQSIATFLKAHTDMSAILEGHTDNQGPASYNQRLSQARANAVKTYLINQYGTDASRLTTIGYGESKPIDTNNTKAGRQHNRRVVAVIHPNQ